MKRIIVIFSAVIAAILAAGIAYASIPAADGTINGCYKNANGDLIVIDSAATCPTGHTALNWNQTGPVGPPGQSGVTSFYTVTDVIVTPDSGEVITGEINCLPGDVVTGYGHQAGDDLYGPSPGYGPMDIIPKEGINPQGMEWRAGRVATALTITIRIVCADLP